MGKIISKLAIIATIATLASNAMAYTIKLDESNSSKEAYSGQCDSGKFFYVSRPHNDRYWYASSSGDNYSHESRDKAIRKVCGE